MIAKDRKTIKTDLYHKNTSLADYDKTSSTLFQEKNGFFIRRFQKFIDQSCIIQQEILKQTHLTLQSYNILLLSTNE